MLGNSFELGGLNLGLVMPGKHDGLGQNLWQTFESLGCRVQPLIPADPPWPADLDLVVLYGPMQSLAGALRCFKEGSCSTAQVVVWYTEPLPPPTWPTSLTAIVADLRSGADRALRRRLFFRRFQTLAGRLRCVGEMRYLQRQGMLALLAVFTGRHRRFFQRWDLPVSVIPMGHHPHFGKLLHRRRDVDVTFLGSTRDRRRRKIVSHLQAQFAQEGITFVLKDGSPEHGSVFGQERARLLNRTKIMLNVMRQPWDDPVFRLLLAAANGAMVLSEPVLDAGPFESGRHFAVAQLGDLVQAVKFYLDADDERAAIAEQARAFVTSELTMEQMGRELLQVWHLRRHEPLGLGQGWR